MNKSQFLELVEGFRTTMNQEFEKPESERNLPEDWLTHDVLSTCYTEGCPRQGLTGKIKVSESLDGVYKVLCGMCHSSVEDLDPMLEDDEDFRLDTRYPDGSSWLRAAW